MFQGSFKQIPQISRYSMVFLILSGFATGMSWLFYFKALQMGNASQVAPIDKLSIMLTIILAIFILKEKISVTVILGSFLIVIGAVLVGLGK